MTKRLSRPRWHGLIVFASAEQWSGVLTSRRLGLAGELAPALLIMWKLTTIRPDSDSEFEGDPVYLAPAVYTGEPAQCTAPCVFVLPPTELSSTTTISIPPYTTSLEIGPGSTTTIVVTVPPITTNSMDFYNVPVSTQQSTGSFQPTPSFNFPPLVTTITRDGGVTQTVTLTIPPWPRVSPGGPGGTDGPGGQPTISTRPNDDKPAIPLPTAPPISKPPYNSVSNPPGQTTEAPGIPWPPGTFRPVPTPVPDEGEDDDEGHKSSCKVWFFFVSTTRLHSMINVIISIAD